MSRGVDFLFHWEENSNMDQTTSADKNKLSMSEIESLLPEYHVGINDSRQLVYINHSDALHSGLINKLRAQREELLASNKQS